MCRTTRRCATSRWPAGFSRVAYAKWSAADAERRIDELLAFFGGTQFNWYVGPSSMPDDLVARLERRGLVVQQRPRLMTAALPLFGELRRADMRSRQTSSFSFSGNMRPVEKASTA